MPPSLNISKKKEQKNAVECCAISPLLASKLPKTQSNLPKSAELSTRGAKLNSRRRVKTQNIIYARDLECQNHSKQCTLKQAKVLDDYGL